MLTEARYRKVIADVCNQRLSDNNDFILALAMSGLNLLPYDDSPVAPFSHYVIAPDPVYEIGAKGEVIIPWPRCWIVDYDWQEHKRPVEKFSFPPTTLKR